MDTIEELLTRRVNEVFPSRSEFEKLLRSGKKIRLYQGFDPSKPNLHIGHLVGLLTLKALQDLGHEVIFLIGDFTGMIGDPSDKSATRPKLTREEVTANAATYKEQAGRILNFEGNNPVQLKFNSAWLDKLTFQDILELSSFFTVQQMIERDMFQKRLKNNKPIHLHEFLYPLMVTYDAIAMDVDLEVGGSDQLFNMTVGRGLVSQHTGREKFALTTKLLTDAEGRKIGKTTGNAINLFGEANDLYGAIMSQPDSAIIPMYELATTVSMEDINHIKTEVTTKPMDIKKKLAFEIVQLCQGEAKALEAQAYFESTFQKKDFGADIQTVVVKLVNPKPLELLENLSLGASNSDRKRMMRDGAVEINSQKITDPNQTLTLSNGDIIKFGKHTYMKIQLE